MVLKYHFKQQSKIMIGIAATFMILVFIFNLLNMNKEWYMLSLIITLLPLFFTANIFSSEIEKKTDFLIFTSRTARYKVLIQKYLSAWIISEIVILVVYISALIMGFEKSLFTLMAIVIYSTVLSLIGLLVSNMSGNTLLGYGIPLGIWALEMVLGASWHENHTFLSTNINLINRSTQIWSNILFMIILIIVLAILNLFIVSKGEHLRRKLTYKGTVTVVAVSLICLFLYNSFFLKLEFWKNNKWIVLTGQNINLHYKNLDSARSEEILKIYDEQSKVLGELFGKNLCYNNVYVWYGDDNNYIRNGSNSYIMPVRTLAKLNPTEYGGKYWHQDINKVLMEPIFKKMGKNNENEILKESWKEYVYYAYIVPKAENKFKENKLIKFQAYYDNKKDYDEILEKSLKDLQSKKDSIHALSSVSTALLYKLDQTNHEKTIELFKYINNSKKRLSYSDIEKFIKENYKDKKIEETLNLYDEIREYHEKYYGDRGYVTDDD